MAKTAELDEDLVVGLKAAKSKRAFFALVLKGSNDGALIVSKTKVPPAAIAEAKKKSGGSAILKGFCQYEDGTYVFETAKDAPATASQAVKLIVKRDAGLTVKAVFRVSADPELLADEGGATPPAAPPAPPQDGAAAIARLNAMTPDIKASLAGPNKSRVQALFVAASGQIKGKNFAAAGKSLDELATLLKQAPLLNDAELTKRLNAMTADIKVALAGPNKASVQALFVATSGQIKNQEFSEASKGLDELEKLVRPGATGGTPGGSAGNAMAAWQVARKAALAKLDAIAAKVKAAKHSKSDVAFMKLKAVAANIPAEPNTPQKIAETQVYLDQDDVVLDVCQFAEDIRTPLLGILDKLKT